VTPGKGLLRVAAPLTALLALALASLLALSDRGDASSTAPAKATGKRAKVIASDTAHRQNPVPFWGQVECAHPSRHQWITSGGDWHPTATGQAQGNDAFRRLHVLDGDDFYGERCELGNDNHKAPTAFYSEGRRRITKISIRLPSGGFPLGAFTWQVVMQMKQAWPAANAGGTPVIELGAYDGKWVLAQSKSPGWSTAGRRLWTARARRDVWTRWSFDVRYSRGKRKGFIKVKVDLNGDGDTRDRGERPKKIRTYTLKREIPGGPGPYRTGASLKSHLRAGIYHDPGIRCDDTDGCYIDIDNVQVVKPGK
jgi:hypothetical protein